MGDEEGGDERVLVEQYLKGFCIEEIMDEVLNQVVMERPKNPYLAIGALMEAKSMPEIMDISLSSVIVSGLRCGVQASILTNIGTFTGTASYSTPSQHIFRNYSTIIDKLKNILLNLDPTNVTAFDEQVAKINDIDQAESLALSIACCRAAARHKVVQPYDIIGTLMGHTEEHMSIPVPVVPVVSRATTNGSNLHTQDITITALNVSSFESAMEYVLTIATSLSKSDLIKTPSAVSSVGCPCVDAPSLAPVIRSVKAVIGDAGLLSKIGVGFHYRAEKLLKQPVDGTPQYVLDLPGAESPAAAAPGGKAPAVAPKGGAAAAAAALAEPPAKTGAEVVEVLAGLWSECEAVSVDSPLAMVDGQSLRALRKKIKETIAEVKAAHSDKLKYHSNGVGGDGSCPLQVLIDESAFAPLKDEEGFINEMPFNTVKVQLNNLTSVTAAVELCKKARKFQCSVAVAVSDSGACVETSDSFLADFAVGVGAGQMYGGGLSSAEFLSNYNRIFEIVASNHKIHFVGGKFRSKSN